MIAPLKGTSLHHLWLAPFSLYFALFVTKKEQVISQLIKIIRFIYWLVPFSFNKHDFPIQKGTSLFPSPLTLSLPAPFPVHPSHLFSIISQFAFSHPHISSPITFALAFINYFSYLCGRIREKQHIHIPSQQASHRGCLFAI